MVKRAPAWCKALLLPFFLCACSPDFWLPRHQVSVSTYATPQADLKIRPGMSFAIAPLKPQELSSLEFHSHAQSLSQLMISQGYQPEVNHENTPDFFILLSYELLPPLLRQEGLSEPPTLIDNGRGQPLWIQGGPTLTSYYPHQAHLQIRQIHGGPEGSGTLFEGTAKLELRHQNMSEAMPSLLKALLQQGFISTSGQWVTVLVPAPSPQ